jgi:hypothetical protein|nr:hypothetical protein [Enterococcus phoeniculicola]
MMDAWDEIVKEWYPEILSKKSYPLKISKHYTSAQRWEIYERLTKNQRALVNKHRRYLIQSQFLEENYLLATDWVFEDFKVNPFFRTSRRQEKLFCKCGRELKVQYIVKSQKTGERLTLGISHFAEHLHVSENVASSISQGMTRVDLAMDELLWLKQQNCPFPEELWQKYHLALMYNNRLKQPKIPNKKLYLRVAEFREAAFPIYISDYQALQKEIDSMYRQTQLEEKTIHVKKTDFFENRTSAEINTKAFIETYQIFLKKDLSGIRTEDCQLTKLPDSYFQELLSLLRKVKHFPPSLAEKTIQEFSDTPQGRWIQPQIYKLILEKYLLHGFKEVFFYEIPRPMRNGLLRVLKKEKEAMKSPLKKENQRNTADSSEKKSVEEWLLVKKQASTSTRKRAFDVLQQLEGLRKEDPSINKVLHDYYVKIKEKLFDDGDTSG